MKLGGLELGGPAQSSVSEFDSRPVSLFEVNVKPYYQRDGITIFCGDCLEIMPLLNCVDLIATDPPYRCISGGKDRLHYSSSGILGKNDGRIFEHNDISTSDYAQIFYHILKLTGHCYLMTNNINLEAALCDFRVVGFKFHGLLCWQKGNALPNRWYMKDFEPVLFFRKGNAVTINNPSAKATLRYRNAINRFHPTQKPVSLFTEIIINSSRVSQLVLDPFMGSGTTLLAAQNEGRRAVGIELSEAYCKIAVERLRQPSFWSIADTAPAKPKNEQQLTLFTKE